MKKFFTLLAVASVAMAANAGTRVLYSQDFEAINSPTDAGWTYGGENMIIASDEFGQYLQLQQGATNGRNAQLTWGDAIYGENAAMIEDGIYTVMFDFNPQQSSNNQYNSGITVLTNLTPAANQPFLGRWTYLKDAEGNDIEDMSLYQGYLFDLTQVQRESEETGSIQMKVNGNADDIVIFDGGMWYTITLTVDVNNRTVSYDVSDVTGSPMTSGVRTVPATECDGTDISMYATGLWVMVARYQTLFNFDNIKVSCESTADVANTPSCALTGLGRDEDDNLNLSLRTYTINFIDGETLHVLGTDGQETAVEFYECDGNYKYTTTTSGILKCWTTCGTATSEVVEVEVDATPCVLPEAVLDIVSVSNGFAKTYKVTVDNKSVPLTPTIFIDVKFVGNDGSIVELNDAGTGGTFAVGDAGDITIVTKAFGYQSTTTTAKNDIEYKEKKVFDFARMTEEQILGAGFAKIDDQRSDQTSGENNWTARKRLYYYDAATETVNEEGETVYTAVYPFGYDDNEDHVIKRYLIEAAANTDDVAANTIAGTIIWPGLAIQMDLHIGILNNATTNNYNAIKILGCDLNDILIFNTVASYGSDSCHPIVNNEEEYFAQFAGTNYAYPVANIGETDLGKKTAGAWRIPEENEDATAPTTYTVAFNLYRIDTALTKATVFQVASTGISDVTVDKNIDNAWYTITGIRLDAPTGRGLYIHNGKKVLVK